MAAWRRRRRRAPPLAGGKLTEAASPWPRRASDDFGRAVALIDGEEEFLTRLAEEPESKPESRATNTIQYHHPTSQGLKLEPYNPHNPNHRHAKKFVEIGTSAADQLLQSQYLNRINRRPAKQHYRMLPLNTAKPRIHGASHLTQQRPLQMRLLPPNPF